jgi:PAS domain S-box-containing protein
MEAPRPPVLNGGRAATPSPEVLEGGLIRTPESDRPVRPLEHELRTVVTGAPVILFSLDSDGTITFSEGAGLAALGIQPGELVGLSAFEVYGEEPALLDCARRALAGEDVAAIISMRGLSWAVRYSPQLGEDGRVVRVIGVATDITAQQQAESELRARLAFDDLIHRIFTEFIRIPPDDVTTAELYDSNISRALGEVGRFIGATRSYILESSYDGGALVNTYEWCADGIVPIIGSLREISIDSVPSVMDQIEFGRQVRYSRVEDLSPEIVSELETFGRSGIRSMVNLPMKAPGGIMGLVGFDWAETSVEVPLPELAQLVVIQSLFSNALQQRRTGGALQRVNRLLRAVLECSDALTRARDEKVLLDEVCRIIVEVGGFRQAWVGFGATDEAQTITPVASWGYDPGYLDNLKITWADTDRGRGPMGKAIRSRAPSAIPNIATDVDFEPWREEAIKRGCRSALAVPLSFGDELLGAIIVYAVVPWAFDTLEVEILQRFAGYLSYGIVALRTHARRESAEAQLRDSLRSKEQLVSSISHEMRTPLTAVVGFAELLQLPDSGISEEERLEMIRSIGVEGRDLTNIVEDLLTAAKAEAGTLTVVCVPVDLRAEAAHVLESMRQDPPIELTGDSLRGSGDPSRVRQILRNLITNAIRYGGDDIRICIIDSLAPRAQVRDNGREIPVEEQERIFTAYQRAHDAPGLTASMGLGLTISRSLARLMGGDLTYRYEESESIFELQLPALHLNRILPEVTMTPELARKHIKIA